MSDLISKAPGVEQGDNCCPECGCHFVGISLFY
jgi:hypothetical protein